jgi:cytochrome c oxidase cbb3-type subunit III
MAIMIGTAQRAEPAKRASVLSCGVGGLCVRKWLRVASAAVLALAGPLVAAQEHSYTQADIENGARLYQSSCAGCHGPNGDMVPGIELQRGRFRRGTSDTEIMRIIQTGLPGTTMPPSSFTEAQAGAIVAFLRSAAPDAAGGTRVLRGSADNGRALFDGKGRCATCHRVNGAGPRVAPDLSDIGAIRPAREIEQKLVDPNALIRPANRMVDITMKDGARVTGHLLNQDTFSVQLLDSRERLLSLARADIRDSTIAKSSPMPSYRETLTAAELSDLVTYLVSLKGERP